MLRGPAAAILLICVIYVSIVLLEIPAIISAFMIGPSSRKQGIHDAILGSLVVPT